MIFDYLIVGAGFCGSTLAERLAREAGKQVLVVDKRAHIGGNAYDEYNGDGILVHRYGPHIFHTNSKDVFAYLSQFTAWRPYEHRVRASVDGRLVPIPINLDTINELYGTRLNSFEVECVESGVTVTVPEGTSMFEAVEEAGVDVMGSCIEGICGTCQADVLGGTPDHRDSVLTRAERERGDTVMLCVSRSLSQKLTLDL